MANETLNEQYFQLWRTILAEVGHWEEAGIRTWIESMAVDMTSPYTFVFHELPSTWAVWELLRPVNGVAGQDYHLARGKLCAFISTLHGGDEFGVPIEWSKVRSEYLRLLGTISDRHS